MAALRRREVDPEVDQDAEEVDQEDDEEVRLRGEGEDQENVLQEEPVLALGVLHTPYKLVLLQG